MAVMSVVVAVMMSVTVVVSAVAVMTVLDVVVVEVYVGAVVVAVVRAVMPPPKGVGKSPKLALFPRVNLIVSRCVWELGKRFCVRQRRRS